MNPVTIRELPDPAAEGWQLYTENGRSDPKRLWVRQMYTYFEAEGTNGKVQGEPGNYILRSPDGTLRVIDSETFDRWENEYYLSEVY